MLKVRDIMTAPVVAVDPELSLRDAMELLVARHVSGAPVVEGGKVVGVISANDLIAFAASLRGVPTERPQQSEWGEWGEWDATGAGSAAERDDGPPAAYFTDLWDDAGVDAVERMAHPEGPEWNALEEHTVGEAMTRSVIAVRPESDARAAAEYMRRAGIHRVLVMEGDDLVGVVSALDFAKAVADDRVKARTYVFNADGEFDRRGWSE